jgi:ADP-ribosylglycohydrolase
MLTRSDRIHGCFFGGAAGDALGAPVEFASLEAIRARFGPDGIGDFAEAYGIVGAITDDTQMTLFTAEGLLRAYVRWAHRGIVHAPSLVAQAYTRWYSTQLGKPEGTGWLVHVPGLQDRRAPGHTCLTALAGSDRGTPEEPINDSKGCGGIMRIAPVGLLGDSFDHYRLGCELAALTHGHEAGYQAAGAFAVIIAAILAGETLDQALDAAAAKVSGETLQALHAARHATTVEDLGEGWVAEEALAIAVHCARTASSFEDGVRRAVNHSGDSDSTGALAGNLLGALLGAEAIPARWLAQLDQREVIATIAADFTAAFADRVDVTTDEWFRRYPGGP